LTLKEPAKRDAGASAKTAGGYYLDDGPGSNPPENLADIPDAVPRAEPPHRFANRPYSAMGRNFVPLDTDADYRASGLASWYGRRFHGKPTSSGEAYDMYAMTAAHPTLPIPSYARVSNPKNGKSVVVRVNDRGPFHSDRLIDLSYTAAWKLGILNGVTRVDIERVLPGDIAQAPPAGGHYLQLAALGNADAAETLYQRLKARQSELGMPGLIRTTSDNLHKIQAGPYADPLEADAAAQVIEREFGMRPFRISR
jgi:rare lipoprotein A